MKAQKGLFFALEVDENGTITPLEDFAAIDRPAGQGAWRWIVLERSHAGARQWLNRKSGLPRLAREAVLAEETRPRATLMAEGMLVILRGVNLNPDADPEDMVSLRLWIQNDRVIALRRRRVLATEDVKANMEAGTGPVTPGELVVALADRLNERMGGVIGGLEDRIDELEEQTTELGGEEMREQLVDLRRTVIPLRRHIAPQRDALSQLMTARVDWLDDRQRARLREVADRLQHFVEELDEIRERAMLLHEEVSARIAEQMNRNMYVLSVVAAIFLPLSLITGLLGINVAGIPGASWPYAFVIVCALLGVLGAAEYWLFRWRKWF